MVSCKPSGAVLAGLIGCLWTAVVVEVDTGLRFGCGHGGGVCRGNLDSRRRCRTLLGASAMVLEPHL